MHLGGYVSREGGHDVVVLRLLGCDMSLDLGEPYLGVGRPIRWKFDVDSCHC